MHVYELLYCLIAVTRLCSRGKPSVQRKTALHAYRRIVTSMQPMVARYLRLIMCLNALQTPGTDIDMMDRRVQVDDCDACLTKEKKFYRRSRCCQMHARELRVLLNGVPRRFCQQCCAFHGLDAFDGAKRCPTTPDWMSHF